MLFCRSVKYNYHDFLIVAQFQLRSKRCCLYFRNIIHNNFYYPSNISHRICCLQQELPNQTRIQRKMGSPLCQLQISTSYHQIPHWSQHDQEASLGHHLCLCNWKQNRPGIFDPHNFPISIPSHFH